MRACRTGRVSVAVVLGAMVGLTETGCDGTPRGAAAKNNLGAMATARVTIINRAGARHAFDVWLARTEPQQMLGLMNVPAKDLPPARGMLFVFDRDELRGFWMHNTVTPLDIAFIRSDGTIVRTATMEPLVETTTPSIEPAQFALEVRAGEFASRGIAAGDRVEFSASVFN